MSQDKILRTIKDNIDELARFYRSGAKKLPEWKENLAQLGRNKPGVLTNLKSMLGLDKSQRLNPRDDAALSRKNEVVSSYNDPLPTARAAQKKQALVSTASSYDDYLPVARAAQKSLVKPQDDREVEISPPPLVFVETEKKLGKNPAEIVDMLKRRINMMLEDQKQLIELYKSEEDKNKDLIEQRQVLLEERKGEDDICTEKRNCRRDLNTKDKLIGKLNRQIYECNLRKSFINEETDKKDLNEFITYEYEQNSVYFQGQELYAIMIRRIVDAGYILFDDDFESLYLTFKDTIESAKKIKEDYKNISLDNKIRTSILWNRLAGFLSSKIATSNSKDIYNKILKAFPRKYQLYIPIISEYLHTMSIEKSSNEIWRDLKKIW